MKIVLTFVLMFVLSLLKAQTTIYAPAGSFTSGIEGPVSDQYGNVYIVNFGKEGTIGKINHLGKASLYISLPDSAVGNALQFNEHGFLLVADYVGHRVFQIDTTSLKCDVLLRDVRMNQPNDLTLSKHLVYLSDPKWSLSTGNVWMINHKKELVLLEKNMGTTNGLVLSPDGHKLYVNESVQRNVWVYDVLSDGTLAHKKLFHRFNAFGMDGMKCDVEGNLYIARYDAGVIAVLSPSGQLIKEVKLIGKKPTNIAFGGKDLKQVFVTMQDDGSVETFINNISGYIPFLK